MYLIVFVRCFTETEKPENDNAIKTKTHRTPVSEAAFSVSDCIGDGSESEESGTQGR